MTLEEIRNSDKDVLTPADIAPILGSDPQTIRTAVRDDPELFGFKATLIGNRIKIPRLRFLAYLGYAEGVIAEK